MLKLNNRAQSAANNWLVDALKVLSNCLSVAVHEPSLRQ